MRSSWANLLVLLLFTAIGVSQGPAAIQGQSSDQPPKIDLLDLKGGHHTLDEYKGKVVVLNFWATYCVPCATEMPMLSQMQKRYKDQIVVLAVSVDDELDRAKLQPFLDKHQASDLTLFVGPTILDLSDWKMGDALPTTLFIDKDGKIVATVKGALKRPDLKKRLAEMTGTTAPANSTSEAHKTPVHKSLEK